MPGSNGALVFYATTEGQTRKIARFAADRLKAKDLAVDLVDAVDRAGYVDFAAYRGVVLAGSIHVGRFQPALVHAISEQAETLVKTPHLFLAVSLSAAAADEPEEREGLAACMETFRHACGWAPARVVHVAGAFRFSAYDWLRRWVMRDIARRKGVEIKPGEDLELTDWEALAAEVDAFATGLQSAVGSSNATPA